MVSHFVQHVCESGLDRFGDFSGRGPDGAKSRWWLSDRARAHIRKLWAPNCGACDWRATRDLGSKHFYLRDHWLPAHMRETDARGPSKNSLRALLLMTAALLIVAALVLGYAAMKGV